MLRAWIVPVLLAFALISMGADSCGTTNSDVNFDKPSHKAKKYGAAGGGYYPPAKKYGSGSGGSSGSGGGSSESGGNCDPNYTGACVPADAADVDCAGGSGDGPEYVGPVRVVGSDHYGLDADGDGYACES
jgi:hypothetical protein